MRNFIVVAAGCSGEATDRAVEVLDAHELVAVNAVPALKVPSSVPAESLYVKAPLVLDAPTLYSEHLHW